MTLFICTAGTSVAGRPRARDETLDAFRERIEEKMKKDRSNTKEHGAFLTAVSAETNGLYRAKADRSDQVALLVTDTEEGELAGQRLKSLIETEFGCRTNVRKVPGLQVRDARRFLSEGLRELFNTLAVLAADAAGEVQINVTGGFKGVVPYLVFYGTFNNIPVSYVYEQSNTPITLLPLPIEFDWERLAAAAEAVFLVCSDAVPEHEWRNALPEDYYVDPGRYDALFQFDDGMVLPSALGFMLKQRMEVAESETQVLWSPRAQRAYDSADEVAQRHYDFMLERVRHPIMRSGFRHAESLHKTDLKVWKRYAKSGPRMLYWVENGSVYVGELFPAHDLYENYIDAKPYTRADYDLTRFAEHQSAGPVDYSHLIQDVRALKGDREEALSELAAEVAALKDVLRQRELERAAETGRIRIEARHAAAARVAGEMNELRAAATRQNEEMTGRIRGLEATILQLERRLAAAAG